MDSMAVFRGMDIGTAKPTREQRQRVPHHLIDIVDPSSDFSLAEYLEHVGCAVERLASRQQLALFVGGTPLYLKALLHGVDSGPPPNPELRTALIRHSAESGIQSLHARLAEVDPVAARRIHPNDLRRIVRALEVFESTGVPISSRQTHFHGASAESRVFCLELPRSTLYDRINRRVELMFQHGLVDEVRRLAAMQAPLSKTARQAVGYQEVLGHLAGECTLAECIDRVRRRTRQFAKRQLTWFRSIRDCIRVPLDKESDPKAVADQICYALRKHDPASCDDRIAE